MVPIFPLPHKPLAGQVDGLVIWHDQVRASLKEAAIRRPNAFFFESVDFLEQDSRIDHNAVADDADLPGVKCAGGNQVKNGLLAVHHESMTGVIPALEADDDVGVLGEEIDDLTFAFVAPLGADDCNVGH